MLQVDENIGGRQDQKNQNLRTKMLAVGLMMVLGCFAAMGYFSATTTTTATDTRVSSPKGNSFQYKKNVFTKFYSIHYPQPHSPQIPASFFSKHNLSLVPAKSMAWSPIYKSIRTSLLQTRHRKTHFQITSTTTYTVSAISLTTLYMLFITPDCVRPIILMMVLLPEVHGLHRREVRVW